MANQTLATANAICGAAIGIARELGFHVAVVCVDKGGHIISAQRMDLAAPQVIEPARRKAATAAAMGAPTALVTQIVAQDDVAARALAVTPDMLAVPGGAPLVVDGVIVGGVGIAGGHYSEDTQILERALATIDAGGGR